ncbi:MAG TPA: glycosyl hydrolase family 28-related protein, partial [Prolixibacteraceae bacterium]|nr:glycosyl hydrolase family 28-related protein [Prolixibacteraceae bacterium]
TVFLVTAGYAQQNISANWQLVTPKYESADAFVAGLNVMDHGADASGMTDQTKLFQSLLDILGSRTNNSGRKADGTPNGGVLFIPEGKYLLQGTLFIPKGVTLRGEWEKPVKGQPIKGTILMAANPNAKGKDCTILPNGTPGTAYEQLSLIIMQPSSAVRDINIWYPDQNAGNIVAYPPAILFGQQGYWGNDYCLASNITLVNAFDGIVFSRRSGGGAPNCYGIYGTPLRRGIEIDNIAEVGRIDQVDFSPDYWAGSGLAGSPALDGPHEKYIKENGTAVVMRRNDWSFICKIKAEGYHTGYRMDLSYNADSNGNKTAPNGHNYGMEFTNCKYGVYAAAVAGAGMMFYECAFTNCDYGFYFDPKAGGVVQIQGSVFDTKKASVYAPTDNTTKIIMNQNVFKSDTVDVRGGLTSVMASDFKNDSNLIRLGANARVIVTGNSFDKEVPVKDVSIYSCIKDTTKIEMTELPHFPYKNQYEFVQKPRRSAFYLATLNGVSEASDDNSAALQELLTRAGSEGGGVVYLPPGHYKFRQPLTLPSGVELKGSVDVPSLPTGPGSVMEIYAGKDDESGMPFISMEQGSGLRGLVMNYPEQVVQLLTEPELNGGDVYHYPYTIRGNSDVYIVNIAFRACYRGIDLFTNSCNNHFVDYPSGHVFKTGIHVGGNSSGGHLYNAQFNQIAYGSGGETKFGAWPNSPDNLQPDHAKYEYEHDMAYAYCWNNLDFILVENCTNQVLYNNFDFGSNHGFTLGENANGICLGQGIDQGMNAFYFEGVGSQGFNFINTQVVTTAPSPGVSQIYRDNNRYFQTSSAFNGKVTFFGADFWGQPQNIAVEVLGGTLELQAGNFENSGQRTFASVNSGAELKIIGTNVNPVSKLITAGSEPQFSIQSSFVDPGTLNIDACALWINNLSHTGVVGPPGGAFTSDRTGWIATASLYDANANLSLDGSIDSRWSTLSSRQVPGQWFRIDMLVPQSFNGIYLESNGSIYRPSSCTVAVSNDNITWTDIASGTNVSMLTFEHQTARYIRITQNGSVNTAWRIAEFYIINTAITPVRDYAINNDNDISLWVDRYDYLNLGKTTGSSTVSIYSITGQPVISSTQVESTLKLYVPSGIYIAIVKNNGKIYRKKFIKR